MFLVPHFCGEKNENCSLFGSFDILTFIHAGTWILKFIFDRFYHFHHMKSRRDGYLEFYRNTRYIRAFPLIIISAGNSALVVLLKILNKYCPEKCTSANLEPINFLQMFVSLETALILPDLIYYLGNLNFQINQSTFIYSLNFFNFFDSKF